MKFFIIFFSVAAFFISAAFAAETGCSKVYSYLVIEEKTGDILSGVRSDEVMYPASLVKMMTLYLTFEALENQRLTPEKILTVSARGEEISKVNRINTMALREGDKITVREAIQAVIVRSFNEAAVTLAEAVSGSEWEFARRMNEKAQSLGMVNSSFRNASGLHEDGQYSTSYDLARLVIALKKNFPKYYHLFASKEFKFRGVKYETHNHVLATYEGAEGLKTGFTNASGFNLVSAALKNGRRVISILLGCSSVPSRDQFTRELLDDAFKKLAEKRRSRIEVRLIKNFDYAARSKKNDDWEEEMHFGMMTDQ